MQVKRNLNDSQSHPNLLVERELSWDTAIADAERMIEGLRESIMVFKARRDAGIPWPGRERPRQKGISKATEIGHHRTA